MKSDDHASNPTQGGRRPRPTIAAVAKRAGVSRSTAGFVLTGRRDQRIAEDTWLKVEGAAKELGYRPNMTARALRTGSTQTVGMISDYVGTTSTANAMVRGAVSALWERDLLLFTAETLGDPVAEEKVIRSLLDRQVDGFIVAAMFTRRVEIPTELASSPVVLLNCLSGESGVSSVVPDEMAAGAEAAQVLLQAGHRDIAFLGTLPGGLLAGSTWGGVASVAGEERLAGIRSALRDAGLELRTIDADDEWDVLNGRHAMGRVLGERSLPEAIICANDPLAIGAYQALHQAGIRVPDDVSIISFDGSPAAQWLMPPLTSIALPHEEMGRIAVQLLLDEPPGQQIRVAMRLLEGASIAPPRP